MMRFCIWINMLLIVCGAYAQNNKNAYALGVEGIQKIDNEEYAEGIKLLKKARNLEPQEYDYTFEIGKAYLNSGSPKKAEKFLFPLQYHSGIQADLYILLSQCYSELEASKKAPNPERKKELDALRYGIQKLPNEGVLYLELAKRHLEMEKPKDALVVLEKGIRKAPNFAENYFWAAKLMKASGNYLWTWIYAETFFNMTDDAELKRSAAILSSIGSTMVLSNNWSANPEKMDQDLRFVLSKRCNSIKEVEIISVQKRKCLLQNWDYEKYSPAPLFNRMKKLEQRGWLEAYLASILQETDKEKFLNWLANNAKMFEEYRNWSYWNPMELKEPITRIIE